MLITGLSNNDLKVVDVAFDVADSIGRCQFTGGYDEQNVIGEQIIIEIKQVISALNSLLDNMPSFRVRRNIEGRLWHWWCFKDDQVASVCEVALRKIDNFPVYQLSKFLFEEHMPFQISIRDWNNRGEIARNEFYNSDRASKYMMSDEPLEELLQSLGLEDEPALWIDLMNKLKEGERNLSWRACKFFFVLGKFYPATAWSFVKEDRELFWQGCKGHLLFSLRLHDHSKWEEELRIFFEQDNIQPNRAIPWLTSFDWHQDLNEVQWEIVDKCLGLEDSLICKFLAANLELIPVTQWEKSARLFCFWLRKILAVLKL